MTEGHVIERDGVAMIARGDTVSILYRDAARLPRTRWLFQQLDTFAARRDGTFIAFLVVLPTADPPDAATRAENAAGLRRHGPRLRRLVTAPVGDAFRTMIVRTVMRALATLQGKSGVHFIVDDVEHGMRRVREAATAATPAVDVMRADLVSLYEALGVSAGRGRASFV